MLNGGNIYFGLIAESFNAFHCAYSSGSEVNFYKRFLGYKEGPALEIGCGTGRILLPLLKAGINIEGIDSSQEMLDICMKDAKELALKPNLYHAYMQDFNLEKLYSAIIVPYCTFPLLPLRETAFSALKAFYNHLEPGGEILIDIFRLFNMKQYANKGSRLTTVETKLEDEKIVRVTTSGWYDHLESLLYSDIKYELLQEGELLNIRETQLQARVYTRREIYNLLRSAGFTNIRVYGNYEYMPLKKEHRKMIVHASVQK